MRSVFNELKKRSLAGLPQDLACKFMFYGIPALQVIAGSARLCNGYSGLIAATAPLVCDPSSCGDSVFHVAHFVDTNCQWKSPIWVILRMTASVKVCRTPARSGAPMTTLLP